MNTKAKIIKALNDLVTLEDASIEDMDVELRKTSTFIVVDTDDIKRAKEFFEIVDGNIAITIDDIDGFGMQIKCPFRKFISLNIQEAFQCESEAAFIKEARLLAAMLEKAAKKVEREMEAK